MNKGTVEGIMLFLMFGWLPLAFLVVSEAGFFAGFFFSFAYIFFLMVVRHFLVVIPSQKEGK